MRVFVSGSRVRVIRSLWTLLRTIRATLEQFRNEKWMWTPSKYCPVVIRSIFDFVHNLININCDISLPQPPKMRITEEKVSASLRDMHISSEFKPHNYCLNTDISEMDVCNLT